MADPKPDRPYHPLDCSIHDRLESAATLRTRMRLTLRREDGEVELLQARIVDVFARAGAEFLKLEGGREIRLDDLLEVNGAPV